MAMRFYFLTIYFLILHHQTIFDCRNLSKVSKSIAINIFFGLMYLAMYMRVRGFTNFGIKLTEPTGQSQGNFNFGPSLLKF